MNSKLILSSLAFLLIIGLNSCKDDDETPMNASGNFTVTIENITEGFEYPNSGETGFLMPGDSETHIFHAGKGHQLSLATMLVQSNDLFIAPFQFGIPLYDLNGNPLTGNITNEFQLWDAGTEVNEEPGVGPNQAPRQAGPNTGVDENGVVSLISNVNDGFDYPAPSEVISIILEHDGGSEFTLRIENVSGNSTLPTPFAPGAWVLHSNTQKAIFSTSEPASSALEKVAEDGDNADMVADLNAVTGIVSPFAPGSYALNDPIFSSGQLASDAFEGLAEDGNPAGFANIFNTPTGASDPGPIFPGGAYSFSFTAQDGDVLSFGTMYVQSNDWVLGASSISLFSNGQALSGDITDQIKLYDAGTEVDEFAGAGNNQAPRQAGPNTGQEESNPIMQILTPSHIPAISEMIRVTVAAN